MSNFIDIKKGTYRHNKTGNLYEVIGVSLDVESEQPKVVYRPLYKNEYELFVRDYQVFCEMVELDGEVKQRFEYVGKK